MERGSSDIIDKLLLENKDKCFLIRLKCINNDKSIFYKDYGIFKDENSILKKQGEINSLINRKNNFTIDLSKEPDDLMYHLKDLFDREDAVIGYEKIELNYYG